MNDKHYINLLRLPTDDMLEYFYINRKDLKDYRVVLFSQKGNHIPQRYENIISNEISMMTLSPEENFFVFDKNNISDTIFKGKSDVALSACVHFDTQIISYLKRIFDDGPKDDCIYNTYSFLRKILINQLDFTNDLYMIENGYKIENLKTLKKTKECLLAYNFYKNNNADAFERNFGFKPRYSEADYTFVETTIKQMQKFEEYHLVFFELFETILCLLLKLACIDFSSQKSYKNKFLQLNDFINQELGMYTERELVICYLYLIKDKGVDAFFKRFKKNSRDLVGAIQSMAWDLTHIRIIEFFMAQDQINNLHFTNHYLVTYDKGLRDILVRYPLDRIVFYKGEYKEVFKQPIQKLVDDINIEEIFIKNQSLRKRVKEKRDLNSLKNILIQELRKILIIKTN